MHSLVYLTILTLPATIAVLCSSGSSCRLRNSSTSWPGMPASASPSSSQSLSWSLHCMVEVFRARMTADPSVTIFVPPPKLRFTKTAPAAQSPMHRVGCRHVQVPQLFWSLFSSMKYRQPEAPIVAVVPLMVVPLSTATISTMRGGIVDQFACRGACDCPLPEQALDSDLWKRMSVRLSISTTGDTLIL